MVTQKRPQAEAADSAIILTKQEAADHLKVSPRYIERMVRAGRIRAYKPTLGLWRIRKAELDRFLEAAATV